MVLFSPNKELFTVTHVHQCMMKPARRERDIRSSTIMKPISVLNFVDRTINKKSHIIPFRTISD